jgi:hypothetical protein
MPPSVLKRLTRKELRKLPDQFSELYEYCTNLQVLMRYNISLKEATLSLGLLSSEEFDQLVKPERKSRQIAENQLHRAITDHYCCCASLQSCWVLTKRQHSVTNRCKQAQKYMASNFRRLQVYSPSISFERLYNSRVLWTLVVGQPVSLCVTIEFRLLAVEDC